MLNRNTVHQEITKRKMEIDGKAIEKINVGKKENS